MSEKIVITTDSTSDIPVEVKEKYNVISIPLLVNLEDGEFLDGVNLTIEQIFNFVKETGILPKTAARSSQCYKEFFEEVKEKTNATKIVHISISSGLSCSCQNAKFAAEELGYVSVVDSLSLSTGCGLLALSAADKASEGKPLETILKELEQETQKVQASFVLDDLKYLYKGGRCSAISMFGANILRIKPKIELKDGKMGVGKKYMGKFESVLDKYVSDLLIENKTPNLKRVFITYTTANVNSIKVIEEKLTAKGFKEVIIGTAGATIASHCGPNTLGVLFINN